jgi:hypothetical protein
MLVFEYLLNDGYNFIVPFEKGAKVKSELIKISLCYFIVIKVQ